MVAVIEDLGFTDAISIPDGESRHLHQALLDTPDIDVYSVAAGSGPASRCSSSSVGGATPGRSRAPFPSIRHIRIPSPCSRRGRFLTVV
jgi:hypothetical protein